MKKLLPCPFCGGEAGIERTGTPRQSCIVACVNCGARHESGDEAQFSGASWNRRTQPAITSESGKPAAQGASAITSESVPLLSDTEIDEHIKTHNEGFIGGMHMVHLCRAIEQAVRSKLGAGVGWIACEDQMPEPGTECLVRVKALSPKQNGPTHYTHIDTWDEQREAPVSWSSATVPIGLGWDSFDFEDVTHWQPLPPPPGIVGKETSK